jgi:hypothetical protein
MALPHACAVPSKLDIRARYRCPSPSPLRRNNKRAKFTSALGLANLCDALVTDQDLHGGRRKPRRQCLVSDIIDLGQYGSVCQRYVSFPDGSIS